jgi:hypothetical protein
LSWSQRATKEQVSLFQFHYSQTLTLINVGGCWLQLKTPTNMGRKVKPRDTKIPVTGNWNWYIWGIFWNPAYGRPWIIPKTISEITS